MSPRISSISAGPRCRACGKLLRKSTSELWFGQSDAQIARDPGRCRPEKPASRAEAQRLVNQQIVSIGRSRHGYIDHVTTWDGESYQDKFFCTNRCAMRLGYAAANSGQVLKEYNDAIAGDA